MPLQITSPAPNALFQISSEPAWPVLQFQTDAVLAEGQKLNWSWSMAWDRFSKQGTEESSTNAWNAQASLSEALTGGVISDIGGSLTVQVTGPGGSASITVRIRATNPSRQEVMEFLASQPNSTGFDRILDAESRMQHFNANGEPIKTFDNGYGMAQLTNPAPSYEQVWNWKLNIAAGLALFAQKQASAIQYLSQNNRTYTPDQLARETISRWNGGAYHEWNGSAWVRRANIVCDVQTGNIGWDMNNPANAGQTAAQLRARDRGNYSRGRQQGDNWNYFGVCYADRLMP